MMGLVKPLYSPEHDKQLNWSYHDSDSCYVYYGHQSKFLFLFFDAEEIISI